MPLASTWPSVKRQSSSPLPQVSRKPTAPTRKAAATQPSTIQGRSMCPAASTAAPRAMPLAFSGRRALPGQNMV